MRPLKLTMCAFGPYSDKEVIDFGNLNDKNIFLITGPTGAGKTTVFDAISYALFGEASGSSRDKDSLRSDFAKPEIPTYVELEFELRGKMYKITRFPQQERKKAKGEGFVLKNADAEFILPDGSVVTKVNAVDEKINSILGINKNQFRQIVMLPQGEFRKLLEAESKEREEIFRKIFGTYAFEAIQRKLDDQQKGIYYKIKDTKTKRDTHASNIDAAEDKVLFMLKSSENINIIEVVNRTSEGIKNDEESYKNADKDIKLLKLEQESLQKSIVEGIEINKKLKYREELKIEYDKENSKEKYYEEKQQQLDKARKALEVKIVEEAYKASVGNLKLKEKEYEETKQRLANEEKNLEFCVKVLQSEEQKEAERKGLSDSIATLKGQEAKVKTYEGKSNSIAKLKEQLLNEEKDLSSFKNILNNKKTKVEELNKQHLLIQKSEVEREKLVKLIAEKELLIKDLRALYGVINSYTKNVDEHKKESISFEEFNKKFNVSKLRYEQMEDSFRRGQAGLLASGLVEGTECPVCGSTTHPKLAKVFEGVPTEEELKLEKAKFEPLQQKREEKLNKLFELNGKITSSKEAIDNKKEDLKSVFGEEVILMPEEEIKNLIGSKGSRLGEELNDLNKEKEQQEKLISSKVNIENSIKLLLEDIKNSEDKLQQIEEKHKEFYGKVISEQETLKNIEQEIPEEIRSYSKLLLRINDLSTKLSNLELAYKTAQENFNKANNSIASAKTRIEAKQKNIEEANAELKHWKQNLEGKIVSAGFSSFEQYAELRMSEEDIKRLEKNILDYKQIISSLRDRLNKAIEDTKDLEEVSVEKLKEQLDEIKTKEAALEDKLKVIYSRIKHNSKILKEIEEINKAISKDEEKYSVIGELSRIANGDNNERISFERYVLAAYFDEIISAANLRLNKMAGGRFILKRKEEKGKGRKQEGLELEVFDNYTGKSRHVKTLSGGESFKASLSLALGLADVVQAYAGGISLDTMFVDEGFGTLDPESLDNAIQCLIDLQKGGRLVGIISHVPELKERIAARLEITPAKEGSKAKFVV